MNFEWNPRKAELNLRKHRVSFTEATTVFVLCYRIWRSQSPFSRRGWGYRQLILRSLSVLPSFIL